DGTALTSLASNGSVRTWKARGEEISLSQIAGGTLTSALSQDGRLVASAGLDGRIRLQEATTGKELATLLPDCRGPLRLALPPDRAVGTAVFAPNGRRVALDMQDGTVALWELITGKRVRVFESASLIVPESPNGGPPGKAVPLAPTDPVLLAFSPDG